MAHEADNWKVSQFTQANPTGPDRSNVPALLRRIADTIELLGDVDIHDIVFHPETGFGHVCEQTGDEEVISMSVYYVRPQPVNHVSE